MSKPKIKREKRVLLARYFLNAHHRDLQLPHFGENVVIEVYSLAKKPLKSK